MPTVARRTPNALLKAMARTRDVFKNKVEEHLTGAWFEFYKARLAEKNGETRWVQHWKTEVHQLLEHALVAALLHGIRGFRDKRRAVDEVVAAMKANDASFRRVALNAVKRDYGLKKVKVGLSDDDAADFWNMAEAVIDAALE